MGNFKKLIASVLLCWVAVFIIFFEIKLSPDKSRWALANKGIGNYSVTVNDCPAFASGSSFKEMRFSFDNRYLMVEGGYKKKNTFAVFKIEEEMIHNIDEYIETACVAEQTQQLDYQIGETLLLDFICWHNDYNYLKFNYEIIHTDNRTTEGFFWFDYEGGKILAVDKDIYR